MKTIGELTNYLQAATDRKEEWISIGRLQIQLYQQTKYQYAVYVDSGFDSKNPASMKFQSQGNFYHISVRPNGGAGIVHSEGTEVEPNETIDSLLEKFPSGSNIRLIVSEFSNFEG